MSLLKRILKKLRAAKNLKYGHQNHTRLEGDCVVKNFVGRSAQKRFKTELISLTKLRPFVPMPELFQVDEDSFEIRTQFVSGINGADVDPSKMAQVQHESGALLKKIHSVPTELFEGEVDGDGQNVLHGDYTIRNLLVSKEDHSISAIIDWEKLCLGDPMRDLLWYEWVLRVSYPVTLHQLDNFYLGYGIAKPAWEVRQAGILNLLQKARDLAESKDDPVGGNYWQQKCAEVERFEELT